jgi:hypothetical protein
VTTATLLRNLCDFILFDWVIACAGLTKRAQRLAPETPGDWDNRIRTLPNRLAARRV